LHGVNDIRQREIHTAELLVPEPNAREFEMDIGMIKKTQTPGFEHILAELFKAWGRTICSDIDKHSNSIWNKKELPKEWKEPIIISVYKNSDKTDCSNYCGISLCQLHTKFYPTSCCQG
jgi:hypothetical protein